MTKEELVIGNRYKIRRPSIADGNVIRISGAMQLWLISLHILRYSVWESIASPTNSAS